MLRRAATERGESWCLSASKVARTMLYGFEEPSDFATTSCMPSVSNTARIGPPAMIPVPGGAARKNTLPAPWRPSTSWCSVRPSRNGTRSRPRLAESVALRIASGTSRALPWPKPTLPFWSPTTTSAAKPKRRPPFTTLATRLMCTSLSTNSLSRSSRSRSRPDLAIVNSVLVGASRPWIIGLETEAAFACRLGQRPDATVIEIGAAVEHDVLYTLGGGPLRDELADRLRRRDIGPGFQAGAQVLLQRGGSGNRLPVRVVNHLRIDVLAGAVHGKPRAAAGIEPDGAAYARLTPFDLITQRLHR